MFEKRSSLSVVALFLLVILLFACLLRFYRLESIPNGLYYDEAFFGDLAYCVLSTGRDFEGVSWPLSSSGHGTSVLPLQFYPAAVSVFVFGFDVFAVRFVPALLGVLIVLVTFLLARFLFNDFVGLLSAFLVAVSPWHVVYSRIGFQNILPMVFFFLLGLYLFLRGLQGNKWFIVLGAFCFGLTFFSYFLSHLFVILFLFGFHCLLYNKIESSGRPRFYYFFLFISLLLVASLKIAPPDKIFVPFSMVEDLPQFLSNLFEQLNVVFSLKGGWSWPPYVNGPGVFYPVYVPLLFLGVFLLFHYKERFNILGD
jgi:predicted membrane-bound mannosyltransferase